MHPEMSTAIQESVNQYSPSTTDNRQTINTVPRIDCRSNCMVYQHTLRNLKVHHHVSSLHLTQRYWDLN